MLTLMLLRHAKSDWDNPGFADYDRPLARRGEKAAPRMGAKIAELGLRPALVLCSGAVRTRQTLTLALKSMGSPPPPTLFDDAIYMARPAGLLDLIRKLPAHAATASPLMIVGHNPGLEELAMELVGDGVHAARQRLAEKFPTCALAVFTFPVPRWADISVNTGNLAFFLTPATLT